MTSIEIREKFLKFFEAKGHTIVPSSSLLPDDKSVLFTTAGMQQFKPYYTGDADPIKDFGSFNTASIQKSMRTSDIEEVGDESHLTLFEMMGNFSFGGYFKEDAIRYAHEFLTKELDLKISYVTVFEGNDALGVPEDMDSAAIWQKIDSLIKIEKQGMEDVFWGPTGTSGPCGPTTEIYCKNAKEQDVETWNIVFNEFFCNGSREKLLKGEAKLIPLNKKGIDTGMGLERLMMIKQHTKNIFETDLFAPILSSITEIQGDKPIEKIRLIADHLRAVTFLIADGIIPGKDERSYIPRRLIRDAMTAHYLFIGANFNKDFFVDPVNTIINIYRDIYLDLSQKREEIISKIRDEVNDYFPILSLVGNIADLKKLYNNFQPNKPWLDQIGEIDLDGRALFGIRQSIGVNWTQMKMVVERAGYIFSQRTLDEYDKAYLEHQEISRVGSEKKFGGHGLLLDTGELRAANEEELKKVTRLHTATHMLQAALRQVLGPEVHQMGSDITAERLRFDFTFPRKLTPEELKLVEDLVNQKIKEDLTMNMVETSIEEAKSSGALTVERAKYAPIVKVYSIENFSKEVCGGPHVTHTGELINFKITKEEASSAGVRRIRAQVT